MEEPSVGVVSEWSSPMVRNGVGTVVHLHPGAGVLEMTIAEEVLLLAAGTLGQSTLIELLALLPRSILEAGFLKAC